MSTTEVLRPAAAEELLARLTRAAYEVTLRHGFLGPFLDVELEIWRALRGVLEQERPAGVARAGRESDETAAHVSVWAAAMRRAV